jgi:hypothetical protein
MIPLTLLISSIALMTGQVANQAAHTGPPQSLSQYIESIHWDPVKSGPLIVVNADKLYIAEDVPKTWAGFGQKLVKAGELNVLTQTWAIALDESELPNPYQDLGPEEKLIFLLATLTPGEISELTGKGISAQELKGEQKQALLSMLPKPLTYHSGMADNHGFRSNTPPETLTDDQLDQVRLQFRKGLVVQYGPMAMKAGFTATSISSLTFHGPTPVPAVSLNDRMEMFGGPKYPGHLVESKEKKSQISWSDSRLAKQIELKSTSLMGELVGAIRTQTGVEVYADARIASLTVNTYGTTISAGDLLRGLALAVGGAVRQVGPAYVLTSDLEGTGTIEAKLKAHAAIGKIDLAVNIARWQAEIQNRRLLESLTFASDDPLQGGSIAAGNFAGKAGPFNQGWVPLSQMPPALQNAVSDSAPTRQANDVQGPVPGLEGKVRLTSELGYRFVLPDGRPMDFRQFNAMNMRHADVVDFNSKESGIPFDAKILPPGSSVAIDGSNSATVARMCTDVKNVGISEVWLDSTNATAIQAAISTGLTVDLIVHPWRILKGEQAVEPDRTLSGQTGSELNNLPEARFDPSGRRYDKFADSLSPSAPDLEAHWNRIVKAIPSKGIHRIVLLDTEPGGYFALPSPGGAVMISGANGGAAESQSLWDMAPELFDFGYTTALRLEFLRKFQIDPVDITKPNQQKLGPPVPYFERAFFPRRLSVYAKVHFPFVQTALGLFSQDWQSYRHDFTSQKMDDLAAKLLQVCPSVYMEGPHIADQMRMRTPSRSVKAGAWKTYPDWKAGDYIYYISFGPENTENDQSELVWRPFISVQKPFTFDLSQVSPDRFPTYLRYLFKTSSGSN